MMSQIPVDFTKVKKEELNKVILRTAIIAELDAINLYEQMAAITITNIYVRSCWTSPGKKRPMSGEFQAMLLRLDKEQVQELEHGKEEVEELWENNWTENLMKKRSELKAWPFLFRLGQESKDKS